MHLEGTGRRICPSIARSTAARETAAARMRTLVMTMPRADTQLLHGS
jgi:hypothetical protein